MEATTSFTKAPWSLSFLSGPLYGRTISLKLGDNWLGSGAECDVIVPDREVAARQLRLSAGQIAVSVQNVGGDEVTLNGVPLDTARRALRHGDVIEMHSMRLGIVPAAQPRAVEVGESETSVRSVFAKLAAKPWAAWVASRRLLLTLGWIWGVLALAGGAYLAIGATDPFWIHASATERLNEVAAALHDYPETSVKAAGGAFVISGYVGTLSDRDRLQRIAQGFPQTSVGDVYVVDELLGSARLYFSDTPLTVTYTGHGTVAVGGAGSHALQQRVANFAKEARPALQVTDHVKYDGVAPVGTKSATPVPGDVPDIVGVYDDGVGTRFIETDDGARYFEGSHLPGGLEVQSIASDRVVFARGADRFFLQVGAGVLRGIPGAPSG